jgi:nitrogen regulatory protein P-II 1
MKKIEAVIRKSKFDEVKEALHKVGVIFFCYWDVTGVGNERQMRFYRSVSYNSSEIQRIYLSIVIDNSFLEIVVAVLLKAAYTKKIGDGKIFISDIEESFRIRTIEDGFDALK